MTGDIVEVAEWVSGLSRSPQWAQPPRRPNDDELLSLERETGRWFHMLCRIAARRQEGGATVLR